jgi:ring-1,2-phenylacetyl-CoA epoxidase subunit PaaE
MSTTFHSLKVSKINQETTNAVSIYFEVPAELKQEFKYKAGQYLTLRQTINGEDIRRSYSICTAPQENELAVSVKQIESGVFSTYANQDLKVGDELQVMPPQGNFKVEPNVLNKNNYVFYAAGSGITPVISMIKSILDVESESQIQLIYGNRSAENTIFKSELDALNAAHSQLAVTYVMSREETGSAQTNGRIDAAKCAAFFDNGHIDLNVAGVYACGPEEMIMCVKDFYLSKGLDKNKIHFELFTTSTPTENVSVESGAPVESEVTVIIDDEEFEFTLNSNGKDILQAAQDEDADVPFSCKGGVCCTCRAKVLEGTVRMDLNFALEESEVEDGFILTCQSHPTSEKVVVSFDEY